MFIRSKIDGIIYLQVLLSHPSKGSTKNLHIGGGNHLLSHHANHSIKKFPISIASFKIIRDNACLYVDKTKILFDEILVSKTNKFHFIARPTLVQDALASL
jgi:hypothetical protein